MVIDDYLKNKNYRLYPWAKAHGISPEIITMYRKGSRCFSVQTMAKIVQATGGEVTYEDLIAEMQERQAGRKQQRLGPAEIVEPGI